MPTHADRLAGVLRVLRLVAPADAAEVERIHAAEDAEADIADGDDTHPLDAVCRELHAAERDYYLQCAEEDRGGPKDGQRAYTRHEKALAALRAALDERFGGGLLAALDDAFGSGRRARDAVRREAVAAMARRSVL